MILKNLAKRVNAANHLLTQRVSLPLLTTNQQQSYQSTMFNARLFSTGGPAGSGSGKGGENKDGQKGTSTKRGLFSKKAPQSGATPATTTTQT